MTAYKWQVRMSGTGGQGIISGAIMLAQAALNDGFNAVQSQVYGPESRGGSTKSEIIIDDEDIFYLKVVCPNVVLLMSPEAYKKYGQDVLPGGMVLLDSSIAKEALPADALIYALPMIEAARTQIGNELVANTLALGALIALSDMISIKSMEEAITERFAAKPKVLDVNLRAFRLGVEMGMAAK